MIIIRAGVQVAELADYYYNRRVAVDNTIYKYLMGPTLLLKCKFYICYLSLNWGLLQYHLAGHAIRKSQFMPRPYVWDGYNGRPATTNLMIHGNVGTGHQL